MKPDRRPPVSAAASGQLRQLYKQLAADAARITAAAETLPPAMVEAALSKNPIRCRQALRHVKRRMPVAPIWQAPRQAAWRFLRPLGDEVAVAVVLLGARNRERVSVEAFGLRFCHHALGRLLDRTVFAADPVRVMLEAHDSLLALDPEDGRQLFDLPRLPLPPAGGCFLAVPESLDDRPMLSARTWIAADQTYPDQQQNLEVWRRFLSNDVPPDKDYNGMKSKEIHREYR